MRLTDVRDHSASVHLWFKTNKQLLAFHLALCRAGDVVWERQAAEDSWIIDNVAEVDNM